MIKKFLLFPLLLALMIIFFSCSDRGNTIIRDNYEASVGPYTHEHEYDEELGFSMFLETSHFRKLKTLTYVPPGYKGPSEGSPYPVLYLLSPYGETENFFFSHNLKEIADRMIGDGEIKPMIIVCVNGFSGYGGTFYGNSWAGGRYTDIIGGIQHEAKTGSLIDFVDDAYNTISDERFPGKGRGNRAISGVGMGGYGSLRTAITYSENFGTVSAISGPLDFDGNPDGTGGFIPLFSQIIDNLTPVLSDTNLTLSDTLRATFMEMDTSYNNPLRTMMFAAATSFSPHDTDYINRQFYPFDWRNPTAPQLWNSDDTLRITDTLTYFSPLGPISPMKYHMPFYNDITVPGVNTNFTYQPIWSLWLDNNLQSILDNHPGALDNMGVLLMTTADAKYNFYQQTLDFASYLQSKGVAFNLNTYEGYEGYNATGERFFYDIVQDILKYHSDRFELLN